MTNKTGFGLDDRIYWTFIQLANHTLSSSSEWTLNWNYSVFQLNSVVLRYTLTILISQIPSHITTDGQSVSKPWYRAQSGAHDQLFITVQQLQSCFVGHLL
jgi:hypothetical protein